MTSSALAGVYEGTCQSAMADTPVGAPIPD